MTADHDHDDPRAAAERQLAALADRSRREPVPPVDVTQRVMAAIAAQPAGRADRVAQRTLVVCALGSLAAAGIVATLAGGWWIDLGDPLLDLMRAVSVVMQ